MKRFLPHILVAALLAPTAHAHRGGPLDKYGCHVAEPHHCHQGGGPAAGPAIAVVVVVAGIAYLVNSARQAWSSRLAAETVPEPPQSASPSGYCEAFADALATCDGAVARGAEAIADNSFLRVTNAVQPPGSRFAASYRCRFSLETGDGLRRASVGLYLAETRAFAEHTQWEDLQIVPIARVHEDGSGASGYGVFKYLEGIE